MHGWIIHSKNKNLHLDNRVNSLSFPCSLKVCIDLGGLVIWMLKDFMKWTHMKKMNRKMLPHSRLLNFFPCFLSLSSPLRYVCHISVIWLSVLICSYGPCGWTVQITLKRFSFITVQITCYIATEDYSRPFSRTIKAKSCPVSVKEFHMAPIFHLLYSFLLFLLYLF